jgi:hypothetical protein
VTNSTNTGNGTSNTGGGNTGHSTLITVLLVSAILLFAAAVLVVLMMMRSARKRAKGDAQPFMQNGFNGQNIPPNQFGQFNSTGSSHGNYPQQFGQPGNFPQQFGQPSQPGSYPQQFGQPVQQPPGNGFMPPYAQPTEANTSINNFAQRQATYAPTCPNCGRPLAPDAINCSVCGMPVELMRR